MIRTFFKCTDWKLTPQDQGVYLHFPNRSYGGVFCTVGKYFPLNQQTPPPFSPSGQMDPGDVLRSAPPGEWGGGGGCLGAGSLGCLSAGLDSTMKTST